MNHCFCYFFSSFSKEVPYTINHKIACRQQACKPRSYVPCQGSVELLVKIKRCFSQRKIWKSIFATNLYVFIRRTVVPVQGKTFVGSISESLQSKSLQSWSLQFHNPYKNNQNPYRHDQNPFRHYQNPYGKYQNPSNLSSSWLNLFSVVDDST